jgi:transposase
MNLKNIHIGECIRIKVEELQIPEVRICKFLDCQEEDIEKAYRSKSIDTELLLRWSKLLEYDFFRLYTGHLMLYAPVSGKKTEARKKSGLPVFRKNIYTQEIKDFILSKVENKSMTMKQILEVYQIPRTTLYKWIKKSDQSK